MKGMLENTKVLDFTFNVAGPTASAELADYGATVIKIEKPSGSEERNFAPMVEGKSLSYCWLNRGKKSVTLNLKDPEAIKVIYKLVEETDVLVESFRPGVMDKLGLGYERLSKINPGLVYCSVSAYGQKGPYAHKPGYDIIAQAVSGMMSVTGEKNGSPMKHGTALADFFSGVAAYGSIMTALYHKEKTGEGQHVDISLVRGMIHLNSTIDRLNEGVVVGRFGNHFNSLAPFGLFNGKEGQSIILAAPSNSMFEKLCTVMNRSDLMQDERFNGVQKRANNQDELIIEIENWLNTFDDIKVALDQLDAMGIASCKVYDSKDVYADEHIMGQKWVVNAPTPDNFTQKTYITRGPLAEFSKTPGEIRKAATLGEHNQEVLGGLGLTSSDIEAISKDN